MHRYNPDTSHRNQGDNGVQFLQLMISGVSQGCIYGLIALGFVLIYKGTETVSFAQGELMMLGAFGGLACMTLMGFPFWLATLSAIAGAMWRCSAWYSSAPSSDPSWASPRSPS